MYSDPARLLVTFRSSHEVLRAEKYLKLRGLPVELIPVPREITSECGFCILTPPGTGEAEESGHIVAGMSIPAIAHGSLSGSPEGTAIRVESLWRVRERAVVGRHRKERLYERIDEVH